MKYHIRQHAVLEKYREISTLIHCWWEYKLGKKIMMGNLALINVITKHFSLT